MKVTIGVCVWEGLSVYCGLETLTPALAPTSNTYVFGKRCMFSVVLELLLLLLRLLLRNMCLGSVACLVWFGTFYFCFCVYF
jgi:hypothetical protein